MSAPRRRAGYWLRRGRRNLVIAVSSAALMLIVFRVADDKDAWAFRASMATGYASIALMAWALIIGPLRVRRGGTPAVSLDLRRDAGIWSAVLAAAHVITGLRVHMQGMWRYYFIHRPRDDDAHLLPVRLDAFGIANWTGLAAIVLLALLVAISNDRTLRTLGPRRWKRLQRLAYFAAVLTLLHAFAYQLMDRRSNGFIVALVVLAGIVGFLQLLGWRIVRRARASAATVAAKPQ